VKHELINIKNCPICSSENHAFWRKGIDHNVSKDEFNIVSCDDCGFRFTNPIPSKKTIGNYYKSENYISHSSTKKGVINKLYHIVRNRAIKQKERLITSLTKEKYLLDIGCGTGDFLGYCKSQNWNAIGLEPDKDARKIALNKNKIETFDLNYLDKVESNSKDVITMWHVLEHVYNLNNDIENYKRILKPNAHLVVAVPNCSSHDADHYKEHWAALDLPIHLYHFTPNDIKNLFEKHNMELVKILPMKFDSYYISMVSEKYKGGNIISGFWRGFISNLKAKKTQKTYSSQIYVLKNIKN
jgi:2-polyprenyl-3-methyl-5-hydroxy-6-metoxy-1,4-benzoquinol methylase